MTGPQKTKYPRKLSPRELRLRIAIVLSGLSLAGAACGTIAWVGMLCMDFPADYPCESEMFMRDKWLLLSAWGIAGVLVILLLMWARRPQRRGP